MYVDKPMRGHNLMQAIARINRVLAAKPGALVVDYIGIAEDLKAALKDYTERDRGQSGDSHGPGDRPAAREIPNRRGPCSTGSTTAPSTPPRPPSASPSSAAPWTGFCGLNPSRRKAPSATFKAVTELSKAFALCAAEDAAINLREDVGFFQAVKAGLTKHTVEGGKSRAELDAAVRQIVSRSVASDQVIDIFASAGLDNP
jgi:type I restriction enzyme R subunit